MDWKIPYTGALISTLATHLYCQNALDSIKEYDNMADKLYNTIRSNSFKQLNQLAYINTNDTRFKDFVWKNMADTKSLNDNSYNAILTGQNALNLICIVSGVAFGILALYGLAKMKCNQVNQFRDRAVTV